MLGHMILLNINKKPYMDSPIKYTITFKAKVIPILSGRWTVW